MDVPLLWKALVQVVKEKKSIYGDKSGETVYVETPGVFQLVIPAETVEDTLNELLPLLSDGDIIIDHGNSNFKDSRKRAERLLSWASNILTAVLVAVFTVWSVDIVLWLAVQILQYPSAVRSLMHSHQVSMPPLELMSQVGYLPLKEVGCAAVDQVQDTLSRWYTMV